MLEFQDCSKADRKFASAPAPDFTNAFELQAHERGLDSIAVPKVHLPVCAPHKPATPIVLIGTIFSLLRPCDNGLEEFPVKRQAEICRLSDFSFGRPGRTRCSCFRRHGEMLGGSLIEDGLEFVYGLLEAGPPAEGFQ